MSDNFLEPQPLGVPCPQCERELQLKKGRYGLFDGCSGYPDCDYMTAADFDPGTNVICPACKQGQLVQKASRYGRSYYACDHDPEGSYAVNLPPVAQVCPLFAYSVLVKLKAAASELLICANDTCYYKSSLKQFHRPTMRR